MNYFIALRLADDPRDRLAALSRRLQEWQLPANWVHPEDYHVTLLFLGNLDADESRTLPYTISDLADSLARPELRLAGLGALGGRTEPRVVYAALEDRSGFCQEAHRDLSEILGMRPERQFMPHVTLCRPRPALLGETSSFSSRRTWPGLLEAHGLADWGDCRTTDLVLYQSGRGERQPRYQELASWPLLKAA
jgi:RNA 2',3'-cyclic 3'-phosphodiesterase